MSKADGKATIMLIEFAGGFTNCNPKKLSSDTNKIYRNAARLLNSKIAPLITNHVYMSLSVITIKSTLNASLSSLIVPISELAWQSWMFPTPHMASRLLCRIFLMCLLGVILSLVPFKKEYLPTMLILRLYQFPKHLKIIQLIFH